MAHATTRKQVDKLKCRITHNAQLYRWPLTPLEAPTWNTSNNGSYFSRPLAENKAEMEKDSRWPAFFPSPLCLVTAEWNGHVALEKVVGISIVNRFPYIAAVSFCRESLSDRHHARTNFMRILESGRAISIQLLPPGCALDAAMNAVTTIPESETERRILASGLKTRPASFQGGPVFEDAYLVYEGTLVNPARDFEGEKIFSKPFIDLGSHRIYFFEIRAIQLREDIASGANHIFWRSLPKWNPLSKPSGFIPTSNEAKIRAPYQKGYNPRYIFPAASTVAFEGETLASGMRIKHLPAHAGDQVEIDNDRARWPCFFPQSAGLITSVSETGEPSFMPCGSTTVLSRHPLIIAPCISYCKINERYAPRASLDNIRRTGKFGCGIPYLDDRMIDAIRYGGSVSLSKDPKKITNAGLDSFEGELSPVLSASPIHFECEVVERQRLGTHMIFYGKVKRILVRSDVTPENPLEWTPWPEITEG